MDLSDDKLKAIQERLKERAKSGAKPARRSKMDVIRASFDHIEKLGKNGFRAADIAAEIAEVGCFDLNAGTLKNYMHRIRVERSSKSSPPSFDKKKASVITSAKKEEHNRGTFQIKPDRDKL